MFKLKGVLATLMIIGLALVSYASDQSPPTEKVQCALKNVDADNHSSLTPATMIMSSASYFAPATSATSTYSASVVTAYASVGSEVQFVRLFRLDSKQNQTATLPDKYNDVIPDRYYLPLRIGSPTGQLHESKLSTNTNFNWRYHLFLC